MQGGGHGGKQGSGQGLSQHIGLEGVRDCVECDVDEKLLDNMKSTGVETSLLCTKLNV